MNCIFGGSGFVQNFEARMNACMAHTHARDRWKRTRAAAGDAPVPLCLDESAESSWPAGHVMPCSATGSGDAPLQWPSLNVTALACDEGDRPPAAVGDGRLLFGSSFGVRGGPLLVRPYGVRRGGACARGDLSAPPSDAERTKSGDAPPLLFVRRLVRSLGCSLPSSSRSSSLSLKSPCPYHAPRPIWPLLLVCERPNLRTPRWLSLGSTSNPEGDVSAFSWSTGRLFRETSRNTCPGGVPQPPAAPSKSLEYLSLIHI